MSCRISVAAVGGGFFRRNKEKIKGCFLVVLSLAVLLFAGTADSGAGKDADGHRIARDIYQREELAVVYVMRGDLTSEFELLLKRSGTKEIAYHAYPSQGMVTDIRISVGDRVKKGDVLVAFDTARWEERIADWEEKIAENKLLMEHCRRMQRIGGGQADLKEQREAYGQQIEELGQENYIGELYIEELKKQIAGNQMIAKADGIITDIKDEAHSMQDGNHISFLEEGAVPEEKISGAVRQTCGGGGRRWCRLRTACLRLRFSYPCLSAASGLPCTR